MAAAAKAAKDKEKHTYGKAASTIKGNDLGTRYCNAYRKTRGLCTLEESTFEEFEEDNLETFFYDFCRFSSSTPIPIHFDENLQRKNDTQKRLCKTVTFKKYIGQARETIRRIHPQHPDFAGLKPREATIWYTGLIAQFERACIAYHLSIGGTEDYEFGETKIQPLLMDNKLSGCGIDAEGLLIPDWITRIDI